MPSRSLAFAALLVSPLAHASQLVNDEVAARAQILEQTAQQSPGAEVPFRLIGEVGTALTRGNTETFHINGQLRLLLVPIENWVSETRGQVLYEESLGETTANAWAASQRVDRYLGTRFTVFGAFGIERNIFQGLGRRLSEQLGGTFLLVDRRIADPDERILDRLRLELGAYAAQEKYTLSPTAEPGTVLERAGADIVAARAAVSYVHAFRKGSEVGLEVEGIQDFIDTDNVLVNTTVWTAAAVMEGIALKISASHFFDNVPADPTLKKSDFLLTAGIVVSL
ncbi:MAG TPA: DUF481 domain-containing protein [Fredinandcohnia sp.]|nr:DUF481 domain-containing protein [Fredinandcohnia sp.]